MQENEFYDQISQTITLLTAAITNVGLYPPTHPRVAPYIDKAYQSLEALLLISSQLTLLLIDEDLISNNRKLILSAATSHVFVKVLKKRSLERITFITGLPRPQLEQLIQDLAAPENRTLHSTSCIKLGRVEVAEDAGSGDGVQEDETIALKKKTAGEELEEFLNYREQGLSQMKELYHSVKNGERINVKVVHGLVTEFIRRFRREMNPLSLLASIKNHDEYTFVHVTNVALLVICQAEGLGFTGANLHDMGIAALLHDVGKLIIPKTIVAKPGALTTAERIVMEQHTSLGAQYLINQKDIPSIALLAALEHHVKFDGTGYPTIPGKWRPHIVSQMITVGDVFDAMRSSRPYREGMPLKDIIGTMRSLSGTVFNPVLLDYFLKLIER